MALGSINCKGIRIILHVKTKKCCSLFESVCGIDKSGTESILHSQKVVILLLKFSALIHYGIYYAANEMEDNPRVVKES